MTGTATDAAANAKASSGRLSIARALPNYDVGGELGRGGMGIVLSGHHRQLDRPVAIKELPSALAEDPAVRARFVAEARVLAALDHPHIVPIYDFTESDGRCLLVMESLPGGTVWDQFADGGFTQATAAAIAMVTCAALEYAHGHGVLHRDIKPENLLFSTSRVLKVTDFGIAKVIGGGQTLATSAGDILGTPAYIAPEQAEGNELGPATDVYATGVMLYELLSGRLPYSDAGGALAIIYRHVHEDPVSILEVVPGLPRALAHVTMQALARDPADRFATAEDFGVAIGEAATAAFGPGWFSGSEMALLGSTRLLASTERLTANAGFAAGWRSGGDARTVGGLAPPETPAGGEATSGGDGTPPLRGPRANARIRPVERSRPRAARISSLDDADLIPVSDVLELPRRSVVPAFVAVALFVGALVLALAGIGSSGREPLGTGMVSVQGRDPALDPPVELEFSAPIDVVVHDLPGGAEMADELRLEYSVPGLPPLPTRTVPLMPVGDNLVAAIEPAAAPYLVAGTVETAVVFFADDERVGEITFGARRAGSSLLTAPGIAAIGATLFTLAYAEGFLRRLRRKRRSISAVVGMVPVGAAFGGCLALLAWVFTGVELSIDTIVACSIVGGAGGLALAVAAARYGRRRRAKRLAGLRQRQSVRSES